MMNFFILIRSIDHVRPYTIRAIRQTYSKLKACISKIDVKYAIDDRVYNTDLHTRPITFIKPGESKDTYVCSSLRVYDLSMPAVDNQGYRQFTASNLTDGRFLFAIDAVVVVNGFTLVFDRIGILHVCYQGKSPIQKEIGYVGIKNASGISNKSKNSAELIDGSVYYLKGTEYDLDCMDIDHLPESPGIPNIKTKIIFSGIKSFAYHAKAKCFYVVDISGKNVHKINSHGVIISSAKIDTKYEDSQFMALRNRCLVVSDGGNTRKCLISLYTTGLSLVTSI